MILALLLGCQNDSNPLSNQAVIEPTLSESTTIEPIIEEMPLQSPSGDLILDCPVDAPTGMSCVYGGSMMRGSDDVHDCAQGENKRFKTQFGPSFEVWVQTFYMDKTEVTYGAYQECMNEGKCDYARPSYQDFNNPQQPMMGVSWFHAQQFCKAYGKRLPTETEWEHAARGPQSSNTPFGNELVTCENAIIKDAKGRSCGISQKGKHPTKGRPWEVGQKPAGHYGLYDMVGNAEEWVADWYIADLEECGENCAGFNPQGPCAGEDSCNKGLKMVKGGSWYWPSQDATGWHRRPHYPNNKPFHHFGFRCAKDIITNPNE